MTCIDPHLRPSRAEREDVAALLAIAFAEGRLDLVEYEDRVAAAYAGRTNADLGRLLLDLPPPGAPSRPRRRPVGARAGSLRPWAQGRS